MPNPIVNKVLDRVGANWLLRCEFNTPMAAPLASIPCEVGGPLVVTDTENKLSVSGGNLVCAGGKATPEQGDPGAIDPALSRSVGLALFTQLTFSDVTKSVMWGWTSTTTPGVPSAHRAQITAQASRFNGVTGNGAAVSNGVQYEFACVLRSAGAFDFSRVGVGAWTLWWVNNSGAFNPVYPVISGNTAPFTADRCRALNLGGPWAQDYGIATARLASANPANTTLSQAYDFTGMADGAIAGWTGGAVATGKLVVTPTTGASIVTNGDMELDANWANYNSPLTNERSNVQADGGTYSRHFAVDAQYEGIAQAVTTVAGTFYDFYARLYGNNTAIRGAIYQDGGELPINLTPAAAWTTAHFVARAPGNVANAAIRFYSTFGVTTADIYVDNVAVKPITLATLFAGPTAGVGYVPARTIATLSGTPASGRPVGVALTNNDLSTIIIAYHNGTQLCLDSLSGGTWTAQTPVAAAQVASATLELRVDGGTVIAIYNGAQTISATLSTTGLTYPRVFSTDPSITISRMDLYQDDASPFTMQSDALVEATWTAVTNATYELSIRRTDRDNRWVNRCSQSGSTVKLIEISGGGETERASAAQTWTNGTAYRVVVIAEAQTIKNYVANVAKNSYASAASNQTAVGVKTSHAVTDLVAWPRFVTLPNL